MSWPSRLTNVFRSEELDRELDDELQFHIEARTENLIQGGLTPEEATWQARRRFGNRLQLHESSRETKLLAWLESILQDVRFGLRMAAKNPLVTAAAILSLSLTIGASTAAFSLIDALFLRPLPVAEPDRLVYLTSTGPDENNVLGLTGNFFSYPAIQALREGTRAEVELFGVGYGGQYQSIVLDGGGKDETIRPQWISGAAFETLGIQAALGRVLTDADDGVPCEGTREGAWIAGLAVPGLRGPRLGLCGLGGEPATVLSYDFWMRRFGGSPDVVGRTLTLSLRGYTTGRFRIAGVAQKGFSGVEPGQPTDLWFPLTTRLPAESLVRTGSDWFLINGRIKPGVTAGQARASLQAAFTKFRRATAAQMPAGRTPQQLENLINAQIQMQPAVKVPANLRTQLERPLWIVAVVAGLVLLLACSNVANLLVARAAAREREMALRVSIGAGRARLVQQMLTESGMLAAVACVLGLAFSAATTPAIVRMLAPSDFPAYLDLHTDWRVVGFLALIGTLTTLLFGLLPALRASGVSPVIALQADGGRRPGKMGILRPLLAAQVGFCFTVLFAGGLLLISFHKLSTVDLGFVKDRVILCTLGTPSEGSRSQDAAGHGTRLLDNARRLPGVEAASLSIGGLVGNLPGLPMLHIGIPGRNTGTSHASYMLISPGFLDTMRIPLLAGRDFVPRDAAPLLPSTVMVNQAFAKTYFPGENPLGKRFERFDRRAGWVPQEIVGVVRNTRYNDLRGKSVPVVFSPCLHIGQSTLEVRVAGDASKVVATLKDAIHRTDPSIHVMGVVLQSTRIDDVLLRERLLAILAGFFASLALVLAATGLYGVMNYSVTLRTKEIGIRLALGARHWVVVRVVIADMLLLTAIGVAGGIAGGLVLARFLSAFLFEVSPSDFWSVALPLACLLAASGLAAFPAAAKAVRVNPIVALRHE